jgi:hypothetical protein
MQALSAPVLLICLGTSAAGKTLAAFYNQN